MLNSLNLDQDRHSVGPDLGLNCFDNKMKLRARKELTQSIVTFSFK